MWVVTSKSLLCLNLQIPLTKMTLNMHRTFKLEMCLAQQLMGSSSRIQRELQGFQGVLVATWMPTKSKCNKTMCFYLNSIIAFHTKVIKEVGIARRTNIILLKCSRSLGIDRSQMHSWMKMEAESHPKCSIPKLQTWATIALDRAPKCAKTFQDLEMVGQAWLWLNSIRIRRCP